MSKTGARCMLAVRLPVGAPIEVVAKPLGTTGNLAVR